VSTNRLSLLLLLKLDCHLAIPILRYLPLSVLLDMVFMMRWFIRNLIGPIRPVFDQILSGLLDSFSYLYSQLLSFLFDLTNIVYFFQRFSKNLSLFYDFLVKLVMKVDPFFLVNRFIAIVLLLSLQDLEPPPHDFDMVVSFFYLSCGLPRVKAQISLLSLSLDQACRVLLLRYLVTHL